MNGVLNTTQKTKQAYLQETAGYLSQKKFVFLILNLLKI